MQIEQLLDNINDAVTLLDAEWRFVRLNHRAELLLRRRADEVIGRSYWEIFPGVVGAPAELELRRAADERVTLDLELFHPSIYAWHQVRAVPVDEGLMLVSRDITDRARMMREDAVRAGIRQIIENVPISVTIMRGPELRIEMLNAMARAGLMGREVDGLPLRAAIPEIEGQGHFEILEEVYATGRPYQGKEIEVAWTPDPDGPTLYAYSNVIYQPILETNGQVNGVIALSLDVTDLVSERKQMAYAAAERDAILEQLVEGVIITDAAGTITFINEAAAEMHGRQKLEVDRDEYTEAYGLLTVEGDPYPPEQLPLYRAAVGDETVRGARWRIRRPDGSEILVEGNARPIADANGEKIAAVLTMRQIEE